jgi:hypothetical protein
VDKLRTDENAANFVVAQLLERLVVVQVVVGSAAENALHFPQMGVGKRTAILSVAPPWWR